MPGRGAPERRVFQELGRDRERESRVLVWQSATLRGEVLQRAPWRRDRAQGRQLFRFEASRNRMIVAAEINVVSPATGTSSTRSRISGIATFAVR